MALCTHAKGGDIARGHADAKPHTMNFAIYLAIYTAMEIEEFISTSWWKCR